MLLTGLEHCQTAYTSDGIIMDSTLPTVLRLLHSCAENPGKCGENAEYPVWAIPARLLPDFCYPSMCRSGFDAGADGRGRCFGYTKFVVAVFEDHLVRTDCPSGESRSVPLGTRVCSLL